MTLARPPSAPKTSEAGTQLLLEEPPFLCVRLSCARWRLEEGLWREIKEAAAVREGCRRRKTAVISPPRGAPLSLRSAAEETLSSVRICRVTFAVIAPPPPVAGAEMAAPRPPDECVTQREPRIRRRLPGSPRSATPGPHPSEES